MGLIRPCNPLLVFSASMPRPTYLTQLQSPLGRSDSRTSVQTSQCTSSSIFQMNGADVKRNCMFQAYSIIYMCVCVCNMTTISSLSSVSKKGILPVGCSTCFNDGWQCDIQNIVFCFSENIYYRIEKSQFS